MKVEASSEAPTTQDSPEWMQEIDWPEILRERAKGVSYKTLHKECAPKVKYRCFWNKLRAMSAVAPETTAHLRHNPGKKTHVDYADGIDIVCPTTGKVTKTQLFVGVLSFSQKTFAEFSFSQKLSSFIESHENMWLFFGGVTEYTVPDNLKSAVTKAHIYDPNVNKTFCSYANHAGFAVLPARSVRPRDKASVECNIGILQRTFYELVRNKTFTNLGELNAALKSFLSEFNAGIMKDYGVSRNDRFEHERTFLKPLPSEKYEISEWKIAVVHSDCHIHVAKALYSVPWSYVGNNVRVRITSRVVEIFNIESAELICAHARAEKLGQRQTNLAHWPPEKQSHLSFDMAFAKNESSKLDPVINELFSHLFDQPFPLRYLRIVQGAMRLVGGQKFSIFDLEYAARCALTHDNYKLSYITACCQFHAGGGVQAKLFSADSLLPERNPKTVHLHTT